MSNNYWYGRTTSACKHITKSLKDNKHIISDIIKDKENKDLFSIKCGENHDNLCLKNRYGEKLDHIVFINTKTHEKYHEHICNLSNYKIN